MFTWIFGSILVPTWLHFTFPNPPKSFKNPTPRAIKILIDFCFDFFSILAPFWGPSWSHVGHLFRAKTPQDAPRTTSKDAPRRPKTPPRRPQGAQNPPQTTILEGFWGHFRRFWEDFWKTFGLTMFRTPWATRLLSYFSFWRGGGFAALLRCWIYIYICI